MSGARPAPADDPDTRTVRVHTARHDYDVRIGAGMLEALPGALPSVLDAPPRRVMLVADDKLRDGPFVEPVERSLRDAGFEVSGAHVLARETRKSMAVAEELLRECAQAGLDRTDCVIALGGGLTGDLAGFVAATYMRGVQVVQCPTTLLAMVDASVGGKTGVNLSARVNAHELLLKNLVGAFHQPRLVLADTDTLATLEQRDFRAGLAECVKHALIAADWGDPDLWEWTRARADRIRQRDGATIAELIERSVRLKANVVAADERETAEPGTPGRMLLNLGHTFGHAMETIETASPAIDASDAPLRHGEAVALGLLCACRAASELGLCDPALRDDTQALLQTLGLPARAHGLAPTEEIIRSMAHDKKSGAGHTRVILPIGAGRCRVVEDPPASVLGVAIDSVRARGS